MGEFEEKALRKFNEALNRWSSAVLEARGVDPLEAYRQHNRDLAKSLPAGSVLVYEDGTQVLFKLAAGRNIYRYYEDRKRPGVKYCYTPWADTKDWYWAFDKKKDGTIRLAVKFRKRKAAKARAYSRYDRART